MAGKHKWIKKAVAGAKVSGAANGAAAGKSPRQYAAEKAGAAGVLGRQARLEENLMKMRGKPSAKAAVRYAAKAVKRG